MQFGDIQSEDGGISGNSQGASSAKTGVSHFGHMR